MLKKCPGTDLLSRCHYHRPQLLDDRVRDGNGYFQPGIGTGNALVMTCRVRVWTSREIPGGNMVKPFDWLVPVS